MSISKMVRVVVEGLEESNAPLGYFCLTFLFGTSLRNLFELLVWEEYDPQHMYWDLLHYYSSYVCLALALILVFHIFTRESVRRTAHVILPAFLILNIVPLVDRLFSDVDRFAVGYMFPEHHGALWMRFFTFFGSMESSGITLGMRVEILLVLVMSFMYFGIKKISLPKRMLGVLTVYAVIFFYCAMPYGYAEFFQLVNLPIQNTPTLFTYWFLVWALFLGSIVLLRAKNGFGIKILKDMRWLRLMHFELMFILGIVGAYGYHQANMVWSPFVLLKGLLIFWVIALAWLFAVMTNNIVDMDIDQISNTQRPLVSGEISAVDYERMAWAVFGVMMGLAWLVGFEVFFLMLVFSCNYWVYSMPPLRLKRVPFFSKILIAFNSFVLILLGMSFYGKIADFKLAQAVFFSVV